MRGVPKCPLSEDAPTAKASSLPCRTAITPEEVEVVAGSTSPEIGQRYPARLVCEAWDVPRSSYCAWKERQGDRVDGAEVTPLKMRGPRTKLSDDELLEFIEKELAGSPFHGEGHRKVHHRLRRRICVGKNRVLRLMQDNHLLSPRRVRPGEPRECTGRGRARDRLLGLLLVRLPASQRPWLHALDRGNHSEPPSSSTAQAFQSRA